MASVRIKYNMKVRLYIASGYISYRNNMVSWEEGGVNKKKTPTGVFFAVREGFEPSVQVEARTTV